MLAPPQPGRTNYKYSAMISHLAIAAPFLSQTTSHIGEHSTWQLREKFLTSPIAPVYGGSRLMKEGAAEIKIVK